MSQSTLLLIPFSFVELAWRRLKRRFLFSFVYILARTSFCFSFSALGCFSPDASL